ncbi:hypothetical protein CKY12_06695 [Photorhabdus sp. S12-55]|nr:hypothetical protein A4R40_13545 [Photorhabdus laumondii subsp. laumondii]RAW75307.1 hypothetical protein CKY15_02360 [Photorhabdus sp. S7-51]RAW76832.1 hypothetical protein CKY14_00820 [Photorhabdus sp. S14-60]RAW80812.1 hypothetical protein CKY06_00820 [Photorhabdus sp. S15-56]RAW86978.1 hypothetical protein CKY12_06695 [Photorhabdus sp. S12-55]
MSNFHKKHITSLILMMLKINMLSWLLLDLFSFIKFILIEFILRVFPSYSYFGYYNFNDIV